MKNKFEKGKKEADNMDGDWEWVPFKWQLLVDPFVSVGTEEYSIQMYSLFK